MTEPRIIDEPVLAGGWNRRRLTFLGVSLVAVATLLVSVREVLLPFILALIIAFVLTPLVALCERVRVPRAVAIILVYVVTLGGIYLSVAAMAPRLYEEAATLARDAPSIGRELNSKWAPRAETWVRGLIDRMEPHPKEPEERQPAFSVTKKDDGSFAVDLGSGVDIVQDGPRRWRVTPQQRDADEQFSVSELANESMATFVGYVKRNVLELIRVGQQIISRMARGIFLFFLTLMVAAYLIHTREEIVGFFRSLPPPQARASFDRLLFRIERGLSGVVRGQLLICLVNGVLSAIGFWLFGLKYWPILAIVAGVGSLIPIFGSILSTIPAVLIGLTQDVWTALWVLAWIIGIHQIEANLLNPKIIGVAAKVHPVLVVLSLIIGEHFFGLWGALLAVPTLSLSQSFFQHFRFELMPDSGPDSLPPPPITSSRRA